MTKEVREKNKMYYQIEEKEHRAYFKQLINKTSGLVKNWEIKPYGINKGQTEVVRYLTIKLETGKGLKKMEIITLLLVDGNWKAMAFQIGIRKF